MARACEVCGKKPAVGHLVSHSARKTKRRWLPNLQRARYVRGGIVRRGLVCTKCLKALGAGRAA